jgi:hypothetical protein
MSRVLNGVLATLVVVLGAEAWAAYAAASRAPQAPPTPLERVRAQIDGQYHDCVPLGWYAQPVSGGRVYPAVNLDIVDNEGPFQALWVAIVPPGRERDPRVADVKATMDALVDAGLLRRSDDPRGIRYNVTRDGARFYFDASETNGNAEEWPYLCYSRVRVAGVAWDARYPDAPGPARSVAKHVRVTWRPEVVGDWASPAIRARTVRLLPSASPADAVVCRYVDDEWIVRPFVRDPAQSLTTTPKAVRC